MPRWLLRLLYAMRGKRRVRLQCVTPGEKPRDITVEGIEVGVWAGHYVLMRGRVIESEESTVQLDSELLEIPKERVIFREVLKGGAR